MGGTVEGRPWDRPGRVRGVSGIGEGLVSVWQGKGQGQENYIEEIGEGWGWDKER